MKKSYLLFVVLISAFIVGFTAYTSNEKPIETNGNDATLYDRLGGQSAIESVVDQFMANLATDTRINGYFASTDMSRLKRLLVEQLCEATGGPCKYTGRDMKSSHAGLGIDKEDFNALIENLEGALNEFNVSKADQKELLKVLQSMAPDIIEK